MEEEEEEEEIALWSVGNVCLVENQVDGNEDAETPATPDISRPVNLYA